MNISAIFKKHILIVGCLYIGNIQLWAQQDATVSARIDANHIMIGDQVRLFIEAKHNNQTSLLWAAIPDTFNKLEIVEKGKIDTIINGNITTLKQRLLITGFDSGIFVIPSFSFSATSGTSAQYIIRTDSFPILVQTVPVDTTKGFKGIKEIMQVKSTWMDYIWYIVGGIIFLLLLAFVIIYFLRHKRTAPPVTTPPPPVETLQEQALRMLAALEQKQLWQKGNIKEYYTELTDIIRGYIEASFGVHTLELTTDEILQNIRRHRELSKHEPLLANILYTADLAKFAKAQPLPQEHMTAMDNSVAFVKATPKPVVTEIPKQS